MWLLSAESEYMALGLSKDDTHSSFDSADAIITGVDKDGKGFAVDYYFQGDRKVLLQSYSFKILKITNYIN